MKENVKHILGYFSKFLIQQIKKRKRKERETKNNFNCECEAKTNKLK